MRMHDEVAPAIWSAGLRKSYAGTAVLDGVDLEVAPGTVFALLGRNGAGKTTLVGILSTLMRADSGSARVGGYDVSTDADGVRTVIGVTGQFCAVDDLLTVRENLLLVADLHHLGRAKRSVRVAQLMERFDLADVAGRRASALSGGMRRRLDLAMTMVGTPAIIFLDEPTTGLDPASRHNAWQLIRQLVSDGVTIFLTTQYLDEADRLADCVAVLKGGRIVAQGSPAQLKRLVPGGHIKLRFDAADDLRSAAAVFAQAIPDQAGLTLQVPSDGGVQSLRWVLQKLDGMQISVTELSVHLPDLDDVFVALTGTHSGASS